VENAYQKESYDGFSSLERVMLKLLGESSSPKEIALSLRLKVDTVKFLQRNLMHKVNVRDRTELVEYAKREENIRISPVELQGGHSGRQAA
jgi:DNA-binding CsgD family transcriptional regulator